MQPYRPGLVTLEDRYVPAFGFGAAWNVTSANYSGAYSIARDTADGVYVSGQFSGIDDFDANQTNPGSNHVLTAASTDSFVAKYLTNGTFQWVTDLGAPTYSGGRVTAGNGVVYASTYGGGSVARLDPATGTVLWNTPVAGGGRTLGMAIDPAGNLDVTGRYAANQVFVAQLNAAGAVQWTTTSSVAVDANGVGVAADSSGNVYSTGAYQGTVAFGTTKLSAATHDVFVWKLSSSGQHVWAGSISSTGDDRGLGVAADAGGNVFVTGWYGSASNNFNPGSGKAVTLPYQGGSLDVFLVKLAPGKNGTMTLAWAEGMGPGAAQSMAIDATGNVYCTGGFSGGYASKFDTNGKLLATADFSGSGSATGRGIAVDAVGDVYTTGYYSGTVDFDPTAGVYNLTATGGTVAFVSKLTQPGPLAVRQLISPVAAASEGLSHSSTAPLELRVPAGRRGISPLEPNPSGAVANCAGTTGPAVSPANQLAGRVNRFDRLPVELPFEDKAEMESVFVG
jgi:sugar lactone lactonase YvrE